MDNRGGPSSGAHIPTKFTTQFVDNKSIKVSIKEEYLGDFVTAKSNSKDTIQDRKTRGYASLAHVIAVL